MSGIGSPAKLRLLGLGLGDRRTDYFDRRFHFRGALEPLFGFLRERLGNDGIQPFIEAAAFAREGESALRCFLAEHLVEHHAEAVDIRAMIDVQCRAFARAPCSPACP